MWRIQIEMIKVKVYGTFISVYSVYKKWATKRNHYMESHYVSNNLRLPRLGISF